MATTLLILAATSAVVDWWAVARGRRSLEVVAKPATMALLVGVASTVGDAPDAVRPWLVIGACFGLVGDVALLGHSRSAFLSGVAAFAVGHLAYVVAAVNVASDIVWASVGALLVAGLLAHRFIGETLPAARRQGGRVLGSAVGAYAVVISAMVVSAWSTADPVAAAGACLFAVSDWVLGYQRFVRVLGRHGRLAVMVPYHVGQAALIVGLATA